MGRHRGVPAYFANWRTVRVLLSHGIRFSERDWQHTMAAVTSHYNIGGGLDPAQALPAGADPEAAFAEAIDVLRRPAIVTVNSSGLRDLLAPHVPAVAYVPNGVDTELFTPAPDHAYDPARPRVGWVGKVKAAKNFAAIEAVAAELEPEGFAFDVRAHGKTAEAEELLGPEAMAAWYRGLDFYLCASWHEGTPNPALEAAACGVPSVTTRVGNMVDLVRDGENGFFVEPDAASIATTLRGLRELGPEEYRAVSTAVRRDVEQHWRWDQAVSGFRNAFAALLERSGGAALPR
jgi:glycosyltransferase involved in cell wall biosynthesis